MSAFQSSKTEEVIVTVPGSPYEQRLRYLDEWRELSDEELQALDLSGVGPAKDAKGSKR